MEGKKLALLRILDILEKYTDEDHRLMQNEFVEKLAELYGIDVERKAIGRNISLLKEAGYDIVTSRTGSYLRERVFTDAEIRVLIDGILSSRYITESYSRDLIDKLCSLSNDYFRSRVRHVSSLGQWDKTENIYVFYNIDIIDEAIENGKMVELDYNKYGTDKKLHKTKTHRISPYQLLLHNQRYYLMGRNEEYGNLIYLRVDHITGMKILDEPLVGISENPGFRYGIDYKRISNSMPYMFSDTPVNVQFIAEKSIIDQIIDWFGKEILIGKYDDNRVMVKLTASPMAMAHWALQYAGFVRVVSPDSLVDEIKSRLSLAAAEYTAAP